MLPSGIKIDQTLNEHAETCKYFNLNLQMKSQKDHLNKTNADSL